MTPLAYYLSFFSLLGLLCIASRVYPPASRVCRLLVWLLLTLFAGLRVGPGRDYFVYVHAYTDTLHSSAYYLEGTWTILNHICRDWLGMPMHLWFTMVAGATYALVFWGFARWRIDWVVGIIPFVLIHQGYFESMNIVRQCLAMAVVFVGLRDLYDRRYVRFALSVLIATCFHTTAVLCLFLLPLALWRFSTLSLLSALAVSLVVGQVFFYDLIDMITHMLPPRYLLYLEGELLYTDSDTGLLMVLLNLIAVALVYLLHHARGREAMPHTFLMRLLVLSVCIYNALYIFGPGLRMMLYPFMAIFLLVPLLIERVQPWTIRLSATLATLALFAHTIKDLSNPKEPYAHYQTVFDQSLPTHDVDKYKNYPKDKYHKRP